MATKVLVAGATGMLGSKIVQHLHTLGAEVRALVRPAKSEVADEMRHAAIEPVFGELHDPDSLLAACAGVSVVVSAVQGLRDIIVDGQNQLLQAAIKQGVQRMIPSDYSVDFFKLEAGENRNLDLRREFNQLLDQAPIQATSILNGAYTEMLTFGFAGIDLQAGTFSYWGDGEQPCDFTTTADTADFIAHAALEQTPPRILRIAGDVLTMNQLHQTLESVFNREFQIIHAGSLEQLQQKIEREKQAVAIDTDDTFPMFQQLQYVHNMVSGRAKLEPLDNDRYPEIQFMAVADFLRPMNRQRSAQQK